MSALRLSLIVVLASLWATPARAVEPAERLLKQDIDRQEAERRERRWDETLPPAPAMPRPGPEAQTEGPCFPIQTIEVAHSEVLGTGVDAVLRAYQGRCLYAADLHALQQRLSALALSRGLVTTQVTIPEQSLIQGRLRLEVWPGRLSAIELGQGLRYMELAMSLPARPGELLNLRYLEQGIENLNRLASVEARVDLLPGAAAGSSRARFSAQRARPWQAGLVFNSESLQADPSNSLRASLILDSPLRLADRFIMGLNANVQDADVRDANGWNLDYDLPLGFWRINLGADRFDYENPITTGLTTFVSSGKSRSLRAELSRLLWRDQTQRFNLALQARRRSSDNFIDDTTIGVSTSRLNVTGLRADWSRVAAPWVADNSLTLEYGETRVRIEPAPADEHYWRALWNARLQRSLGAQMLSLNLNAQWSDDRLLASEQFSLMGEGSVRGYAPQNVYANSALGLRLEWSRNIPVQQWGLHALRPGLSLDHSWAPGLADDQGSPHFAALAARLSGQWRYALAALTVSHGLESLSTHASPYDWQLDASLSLQW